MPRPSQSDSALKMDAIVFDLCSAYVISLAFVEELLRLKSATSMQVATQGETATRAQEDRKFAAGTVLGTQKRSRKWQQLGTG